MLDAEARIMTAHEQKYLVPLKMIQLKDFTDFEIKVKIFNRNISTTVFNSQKTTCYAHHNS